MKKISFLLFTILLLVIGSNGHEFWLKPSEYILNNPSIVFIKFNVGENFLGENWKGNNSNVELLNYYSPNGSAINLTNTGLASKGDSLQLIIKLPGTHFVTYTSKNNFISLNAKAFNDYLVEDGLTEAIDYRKAHNEDTLVGNELYQRNCKTIIQ